MGKQEMVAWNPDDDLKIIELHKTMGPRWSTIAARFPGRTVSSIRNRFLRLSAGTKLREEGKITKNRCQACGEPKRGHICKVKLAKMQVASDGPIVCPPAAPPAAITPAEHLVDFSQQEVKENTTVQTEFPVAAASVAVTQPLVTPPPHMGLPSHMLAERQGSLGLPTSSPLLLMRPAFTFQPAHAFEPEDDELDEESEEDAEAEDAAASSAADGMMIGAPMSAIPPRMLMVDIGNNTDDEDGDKPSTPAAA